MDSEYLNHLISFLLGLASMTYFHNVFVSISYYKSGHSNVNVSNLLKIIFNLSGVSHSVITYAAIMIITRCTLLSYLINLSSFFYRSSLAAFLLWRLKQIEYSTWDRWISFGLFLTRTILNISVIIILNPNPTYSISEGVDCSNSTLQGPMFFQLGYIGLDFLIDTFVTIRLVQILNDGNRNSAEVTSIIGRSNSSTRRTTLFTAVLYWNFLRLTIDFLYNGITVVTVTNYNIDNTVKIIVNSLLCFVTISQSYLITVDAEIVKVIEGRNLNDFNQNDLEWLSGNGSGSISNFPTTMISIPSSRTQAAARSVTSIYHKILQRTTSSNNVSNRNRNNTQSWFTSPSTSPTSPTYPQQNNLLNPNSRQNSNSNSSTRQIKRPTDTLRHTASFQLDKGKFVVVSMQRLTFFEWANMVTGHNNNNCGNCSKCSVSNSSPGTPVIEEIPDVPPLPTHIQDQRQLQRQFTQPQRQFTNHHQRQISQDDVEALLPSLAYISQSRRGSDTSTMTNSTTQTKTNDNPPIDNYKHSFI